ncbi:PDDEXK nuclease domain-containing protein [Thiothrix eikelboomii]|uniref:PDDEXK nuclease domain-containing protein n=1 Tax=Thiothrix eikelboomii TaxID=92487 RepID=UPI003BAFD6C7
MSNQPLTHLPEQLYEAIRQLLQAANQQVQQTINDRMLHCYWHVGRLIVEHEQQGAARAEYGKQTLQYLSGKLSKEFGDGFKARNLRYMRAFYLEYPIWHSVRAKLTWTHYRHLLRVDNIHARDWYANEAITQGWSTRALDRQISTLFYERLLSSGEHQAGVAMEAQQLIAAQAAPDPRDFIRDPYVLEFLGATAGAHLYEKDMEQGLIDQLQAFLMELGKGFAFVARQKHLRVEGEDFFVDLVFYNYLLKCFVLIDLKVGKLAHQDVGQMDMYVRVFEEQYRGDGDNPTLGLLLCSERNHAVAKYSQLRENPHLFASKYSLYLPTEEELRIELERDRALIENALAEAHSPYTASMGGKL